ncbi:hypothetical protein JCM17961_06530 [Endothiovibrio diazotrophicus]
MSGLAVRLAESPLRGWWQLFGGGWLTLVVYLSLTGSPPQVDLGIDAADKLEHLAAYGWLMGWFAPLWPAWRHRLRLAAALIALGITLEFLQQLGGVRHFEVADMAANATGVLIAFGGWQWIGKRNTPQFL